MVIVMVLRDGSSDPYGKRKDEMTMMEIMNPSLRPNVNANYQHGSVSLRLTARNHALDTRVVPREVKLI